jgi:peptidoglycan/LPS O-acetylase OafA/YrhL
MSIHSESAHIEPCAPADYQLSSAKPRQTGLPRDTAIDFTKGSLVLFMVLYHWLNYFVGTYGQYYDYLRFLTPSFIFITGFMISQIHLCRYERSGRSLAKRLTVRGFKLLAVFLVLNTLAGVWLSRPPVWRAALGRFLHNICWAFIVANPMASEGQKSVSFSMLVPIAYLLILSAGLVILTRREKYAFGCTLFVLIVAVVLSRAYEMVNSYLDLLMIGVLGVVIGFGGKAQKAFVVSHPYVLIALYCCYLAVITIWGVTLPLQVASVILTTVLLYIAGSSGAARGAALRPTVMVGKYSLLAYISQIAFLQGLRRISWLTQHGVGALLLALLLGVLLTVLVVEATDVARRKSRLADDLYRLFFA